MIVNVLEDINFRNLIETQIYEVIDYLLASNEEFSITANLDGINFDPSIPESIFKTFAHYTLFTLANYTYESIVLTDTHISFETGFGEENFGSVVTIPLYAIFQIIINESILFLNPTATVEKFINQKENNLTKEIDDEQKKRSMNAFTMNKKNKGLI
jgi:hypothetical protein